MIAPGSPTVRRRRLAAELRGIRESKGKSGDTVAAALKWSPSKISRYERARTGLRPREVERLLDYYEITGPRRALLLGLAEDAAQKGWWEEHADSLSEDYKQFIGLEHEATSMAIWHVDVVTGLLQTEEYARHIIGSFGQDADAMLQDVVSTEHLRSGFTLEGERDTYLHRIAFQMLSEASLDPAASRALILKTAESYWSGAQRHAHA